MRYALSYGAPKTTVPPKAFNCIYTVIHVRHSAKYDWRKLKIIGFLVYLIPFSGQSGIPLRRPPLWTAWPVYTKPTVWVPVKLLILTWYCRLDVSIVLVLDAVPQVNWERRLIPLIGLLLQLTDWGMLGSRPDPVPCHLADRLTNGQIILSYCGVESLITGAMSLLIWWSAAVETAVIMVRRHCRLQLHIKLYRRLSACLWFPNTLSPVIWFTVVCLSSCTQHVWWPVLCYILRGRGSGTFCRLNCKVMTLLDNSSGVYIDISIRVVGLRRFVTLCKLAPYRNSLTYLITYLAIIVYEWQHEPNSWWILQYC